MRDPREGRRGWGPFADWMEVDKRGTRKRRAWKFRGISGKKGVISVGVPRELWTLAYGAIDCVRPNELLANPLEGKSDRSLAQEGHWLMFFYASLRSALWISRGSPAPLIPFTRFVFPRAGARSFDTAVNVFWDPIESAGRRITKKCDFAIYAYHPWNSIFWRSADQRIIMLSALATTSLCAVLFAFPFMFFFSFTAFHRYRVFWRDAVIMNLSLLCLFKKAIFRDGGGYYKLDKYLVIYCDMCYWNCVSLQRRLSLLLPFH